MSSQGDLIGGRTHQMDAAAQRFLTELASFEDSAKRITAAVADLEADWFGRGSTAYQNAMSTWNTHIMAVLNDLRQLTQGLQGSSQALSDLDQLMASKFSGYE
ncbi:WXG100 family type VII secretion target [Thermogemmatispora sp.]|uniref:WXG100 family type VII secretion target n=1 Tax=Thermogemmatispora sp. TaxID=1968838 RepID=UPI001DA9C03E|nr:WXG100 family type VII secretion target [Thermogemmatispora sp.]MBX5452011.1 WXG100 family type VII secretion target [Thermogemmatispora sp.]